MWDRFITALDWARHPEKYKDLENDEKERFTGRKEKRTLSSCAIKRPRTRQKVSEAAAAAGQGQPLSGCGRKEAAGSKFEREKVKEKSSVQNGGLFDIKGHREPEGAGLVRCF
ncbi:MAG: hypothetical protein ACLUNQ_05345 [Oscillospiraceae bacterium]